MALVEFPPNIINKFFGSFWKKKRKIKKDFGEFLGGFQLFFDGGCPGENHKQNHQYHHLSRCSGSHPSATGYPIHKHNKFIKRFHGGRVASNSGCMVG